MLGALSGNREVAAFEDALSTRAGLAVVGWLGLGLQGAEACLLDAVRGVTLRVLRCHACWQVAGSALVVEGHRRAAFEEVRIVLRGFSSSCELVHGEIRFLLLVVLGLVLHEFMGNGRCTTGADAHRSAGFVERRAQVVVLLLALEFA